MCGLWVGLTSPQALTVLNSDCRNVGLLGFISIHSRGARSTPLGPSAAVALVPAGWSGSSMRQPQSICIGSAPMEASSVRLSCLSIFASEAHLPDLHRSSRKKMRSGVTVAEVPHAERPDDAPDMRTNIRTKATRTWRKLSITKLRALPLTPASVESMLRSPLQLPPSPPTAAPAAQRLRLRSPGCPLILSWDAGSAARPLQLRGDLCSPKRFRRLVSSVLHACHLGHVDAELSVFALRSATSQGKTRPLSSFTEATTLAGSTPQPGSWLPVRTRSGMQPR
mmetsp:Transcript_2080/g.4721  ORF Transcript_2080/g.4721 Transcript_2080/m.4721 type:complete len:281 (-) Transcript_2080:10-852(-)